MWSRATLERKDLTLRKRKPAGLCVMQAGATNSVDLLSPASTRDQARAEHELVDMGAVAQTLKAQSRGTCGPASKARPSVKCGQCA
jgi:hypothetical protein